MLTRIVVVISDSAGVLRCLEVISEINKSFENRKRLTRASNRRILLRVLQLVLELVLRLASGLLSGLDMVTQA